MPTTTIRVDTETHARLVEIAAAAGTPLIETVRDATEALRRQRFGSEVAAELAGLSQSPEAWDDYLAEAEASDVADGIG